MSAETTYAGKIEALKARVATMVRERDAALQAGDPAAPSAPWRECLRVFSFLMNLSPEDYRNLRFHTGLITGSPLFMFWHPDPPLYP